MKKVYPYLMLIFCLIFATLVWEYIKIPYNEENLIHGEFLIKKYHPNNEILRFLFFIFFPLIVFFFLFSNKTDCFNLLPGKENFFLEKKKNYASYNSNLNIITVLLVGFVVIDFFSLEFKNYISSIDSVHEGTFLVPPKNYIFSEKFWLSTIYDYGFLANNIGTILNKLFNNYTIGSVRFSSIFLILLNKIILILICRKITMFLNLNHTSKNIFFIFFAFSILTLTYYSHQWTSPFPPRAFFFLLFFLIVIDLLTTNKNKIFKSLIIGSFSLISLLWYLDIGFYTNATLLILLSYFLFEKKFLIFFFTLLGIIIAWIIFFMLLPMEEINEFFFQIKFIISISDYLLGIEYPKPFSEGSTRSTKALLLIILSGIFSINLLFDKKININYETKLVIILLFISSIIFFKSALMRSDTPHIKYSSGFYMFLIYFSSLFYIFYYFEKKKIVQNFLIFINKKKYFLLVLIIALFSIIISDQRNIKNLLYIKKNIDILFKAKDEVYLSNKQINFIKRYKQLSNNESCVQIFTDDISLPYLLNKPSCTQFYIPAHIIIGWTENRFINQLNNNLPKYIIYSSPINWLSNRKNMPNAVNFIHQNYIFYKKIDEWVIYKKK